MEAFLEQAEREAEGLDDSELCLLADGESARLDGRVELLRCMFPCSAELSL